MVPSAVCPSVCRVTCYFSGVPEEPPAPAHDTVKTNITLQSRKASDEPGMGLPSIVSVLWPCSAATEYRIHCDVLENL